MSLFLSILGYTSIEDGLRFEMSGFESIEIVLVPVSKRCVTYIESSCRQTSLLLLLLPLSDDHDV